MAVTVDDLIQKLNAQAVVINQMTPVLAQVQADIVWLKTQIVPNLQAKLDEAGIAADGNAGLLNAHLAALTALDQQTTPTP